MGDRFGSTKKILKAFLQTPFVWTLLSSMLLSGCTFEAKVKNNSSAPSSGSGGDSGSPSTISAAITSALSPINASNQSAYAVSGTCSNTNSITLKVNTSEFSQDIPCSAGSWSAVLDLSNVSLGNATITIHNSSSSASLVSNNVTVDSTNPTLAGSITDGTYFNSTSQSTVLSWTAASDAHSGIQKYQIALGTSSGATNVLNWTDIGNVTSHTLTGLSLSNGSTYYPSVRAVDVAANTSSAIVGDGWIVDTDNPTQPLSFLDMNFGSITESPLMQWLATTDSGSGLANYQMALGSTPGSTDIQNWQSVGSNTQAKITGLSLTNGTVYYPSLRAVDAAGNVSTTSSNDGWRAVSVWKNQESGVSNYLNNAVRGIAQQSDGKRILVGDFTYGGGTIQKYASRVNADGSVDTSFNMGTGFNGQVKTSAIQSDGKILVGGDFTEYNGIAQRGLTRLNTDGSLDTSFNIGTGVSGTVSTLAIQSDAKILVGGWFSVFNGTSVGPLLVRLNTDGSLDTRFNTGTGFTGAAGASVEALAIQSDGKIVVGGGFNAYNGTTQNFITRLNTDGTRDTGFNIGTGFSGGFYGVYTIAIQADGKILAGGQNLFTYNGNSAMGCMARINANGSWDGTFMANINSCDEIRSIIVQPDQKILVGGNFDNLAGINNIIRLTSTGATDPTFGVTTGLTGYGVYAMNLLAGGSILATGYFANYNGTSLPGHIVKLTSAGALDATFSLGLEPFGRSLSIQADNKIFVGGAFTAVNGSAALKLARFNADGSFDNTLSVGTGFTGGIAGPRAVAIQSDGKILVGGGFTSYNGTNQSRITRLNADGSLDTGFVIGSGFTSGFFPQINALALQTDGKTVAGGSFTGYNGTGQNNITRLNTDGSIDSSFSIGTGFTGTVSALVLQADGKIIAGGLFTGYNGTGQNYITRINTDGSIDSSFSIGTGFGAAVNALALQSDGKIIVGGNFTSFNGNTQNYLARLNSDGSYDSTFNTGTGFASSVTTLALQSDGKIVVGGNFTSFNGNNQNYLVRLNSDGSYDSTFNTGAGFGAAVNTLAIHSSGRILSGGSFSSFNGTSTGGFILLGW